VAEDGIEDWDGGTGWGITSWAVCDPSELPATITDTWRIEVWERRDGSRVPTGRVSSYRGPEHCDWQDVLILELGGRTYLRDPEGKLADLARGAFLADTVLPDEARDTGYRRDGLALWAEPSGQAVYAVDGDRVERWPLAERPGCA
jgi:hypothetical protein